MRLLSSDDKLLSSTSDTLSKLQEKHPGPHRNTSWPLPPENPDPMICTRDDIKNAIKSFRNGAGAGPDGLRPGHLKQLTADILGPAAISLLDALVDFVNNIALEGNVPQVMVPIFYGAGLIALSKPDNGVRPIAVGLTLRRKVVTGKLKDKCSELLHPHQLGVALPREAEIGTHSLRQYVHHNHTNDKLVAKIDFKNAFNTIRRDVVLTKVIECVPALFKMTKQSYSTPSYLYFGDKDILESREGVQQGDPLGSFLFSLGIMDLMKSCESELSIWYLDDGTVAGDPSVVHRDLTKILSSSI